MMELTDGTLYLYVRTVSVSVTEQNVFGSRELGSQVLATSNDPSEQPSFGRIRIRVASPAILRSLQQESALLNGSITPSLRAIDPQLAFTVAEFATPGCFTTTYRCTCADAFGQQIRTTDAWRLDTLFFKTASAIYIGITLSVHHP